jgi:hypothetical protein
MARSAGAAEVLDYEPTVFLQKPAALLVTFAAAGKSNSQSNSKSCGEIISFDIGGKGYKR